MPRKHQRNNNRSNGSNFTFVNSTLSKAEKEILLEWSEENTDDFPTLFDDLITSGHKISFGYRSDQGTVTMSITCLDEESPNYQMILMSYARNFWEVMGVGLWKAYVYFGEGEWASGDEDIDFG